MGILTRQMKRPQSFVLKKQFTERPGIERKLLGTPSDILWRRDQGQIPGGHNSSRHIFRKSRTRTKRELKTPESK